MDIIQKEHDKIWSFSQKSKALNATQAIIEQLKNARNQISADSTSTQITMAKLQTPVKASFDEMTASLKTTRGGHNNYQKALDRLFKDKPLPSSEIDVLSQHSTLINRAVYLHLLREGLFDVASKLQQEASERTQLQQGLQSVDGKDMVVENSLGLDQGLPADMLGRFQGMHHVLYELKTNHNLQPAIEWSRANRAALESRGSNLEFELCRLEYTNLLLEGCRDGIVLQESQMRALLYAQTEFQSFRSRYLIEIQQLLGAMAYSSNLNESPYHAKLNTTASWDEVAASFTREFCSLLELSADSPLYIASTAGAIALPPLLKLQAIQKQKKAGWTSSNELPVETPLPPTYQFHSIFVCPVSKEQSTDQNPPLMISCGHVMCQESVSRLSKGTKFKCPYCPLESDPKNAKRVFL